MGPLLRFFFFFFLENVGTAGTVLEPGVNCAPGCKQPSVVPGSWVGCCAASRVLGPPVRCPLSIRGLSL